MHSEARSAYSTIAIRTPRAAEYGVFAQVTQRLMAVDESDRSGFAQLADAVVDNQRLWAALSEDLMGEHNALPLALRAQLVSLAEFVRRHSISVLGGKASVAALVDVNTAIMKGLRGDVEAAA